MLKRDIMKLTDLRTDEGEGTEARGITGYCSDADMTGQQTNGWIQRRKGSGIIEKILPACVIARQLDTEEAVCQDILGC